jgi:hypothetical protein
MRLVHVRDLSSRREAAGASTLEPMWRLAQSALVVTLVAVGQGCSVVPCAGSDCEVPCVGPGCPVACDSAAEPECCQGGCDSDVLVRAECRQGTWTCPDRSVSFATCPGARICLGPLPRPPPYPGCETWDGACAYLRCPVDLMRRRHATCRNDRDCVPAALTSACAVTTSCDPPLVNAANQSAFEQEAQAFVDTWCDPDDASCQRDCSKWSPHSSPACMAGVCEWEPQCDPATQPRCCVGACENDVEVIPVCDGRRWSCPNGSVDFASCPGDRVCQGLDCTSHGLLECDENNLCPLEGWFCLQGCCGSLL